MPRRVPRTFTLSAELVAAHAGAPVVCLDERAIGSTLRLHASRPGAETNRRIRADGEDFGGLSFEAPEPPDPEALLLCVVEIRGVLEQRAGFHDVCGGWTDGHDAVAERICAGLTESNVLLVVDSPGGACAGLQEAIRSVQKAKADYGRRIIAWADEQIGSAAAWWVLSVADEVYIPEAGAIGSIGARYAHTSFAGALAKEGVEVTHICWPNEGKVALASDMPLSDLGRARAQRDINDAGEAFAAAVLAGPVAQASGLTRDAIVTLGADMLTGRRAVAAGLASDVSTFDEVMTYALALAGGGDGMATEYDKTTTTEEHFFQDEEEESPEEKKDEDAMGDGSEDKEEDEEEESSDDEKEPEAEGDEPEKDAEDEEKKPEATARAKAPRAMPQTASLAEILGARGDSMPALKTAAIALRQVRDHAAKLTGQKSASGIVGGLSAIAEDAGEVGKLRGDMKAQQKKWADRERMDLLGKLAAANLPGYTRGDLFVDTTEDVFNEKGQRTGAKRVAVRPAKQYAEMKLSTLRGIVDNKVKNGGSSTKRKTPFEPDRAAAEQAAKGAKDGKPSAAAIEAAKSHPDVIRMANRPGNQIPIEKIAESFAAHGFGGVQ